MADPTYRSSATTTTVVAASIALTTPAGAASGDMLIASLVGVGGATITAPDATWTRMGAEQTQNTVDVAYFYKLLIAAPAATYTFTSAGAAQMGGVMTCIQGTSLTITSSSVASAATATVFTTAALTTKFANALIVTAYSTQLSACTWTPPSGETERQDGNSGYSINDEVQAAAGTTGTKASTASVSTSAAYLICVVESALYIGAAANIQGLAGVSLAGNSRR